jgi:hypothetical protein
MRYVDEAQLVSNIGAMATDKWFCNGLFDPYVAVGGHQPMGFDQMMAYYAYALVYSSKITVTFMPRSTTELASPVACGIQPVATDASVVAYTDWTSAKEAGHSVKFISHTSPSATCSAVFNYRKCTGQIVNTLADSANTVAANAARLWTFVVWLQSVDKVSTSVTYDVVVVLDYTVRFYDHKYLPAS